MFEKFFDENKYIVAAIMIVVGLVFCFAGNAMVNVILFITGAVVAFAGISYVTFWALETMNKEASTTVQWVIIVGSAVLGLLAGFAVKTYRTIGISCLAAWGGVALGMLLTTTFLISNVYSKYAIIIGCAVVIGFFAFKVEKLVVIIVTGFIGSYMIVRGISLYAGGFPNEMAVGREISEGGVDFDQFPKTFYGYLAGIGVCAIVGVIVQLKQNKHKDNQNN
jgi:hypothetical protein